VGNDSAKTSATINLLYGTGGVFNQTGLFVAGNGSLTFAPGQTFPGTATVTGVGRDAGLTGGSITKSGTISIPAAGVTNAMLASSSVTVVTGLGLSGEGAVSLGGMVMLSGNFSGTPDGVAYFSSPANLTSTAAPTNGQILIGSTGKAPVLSTLTAGPNISITNSPGSVTISTAGGSGSPTLQLFVTGGARTGGLLSATQNINKLWGFFLPYNVATTEVTYDVTTLDDTANEYDIGIYSNSGNLVVDIGPTPGTSFAPSETFHTLNWIQGSTNLEAGRYYLALTTNCSTNCAKVAAATSSVSFATNVSAGTSQGGALPPTLTPPADVWTTGNQPMVVIH